VSDSCLTPIRQFVQLYQGEYKLIINEMRWSWGLLCSRPTRWVEFV